MVFHWKQFIGCLEEELKPSDIAASDPRIVNARKVDEDFI
jgi:hypothetical protein